MKNIPVVLAAFGTITKALETYSFMNDIFVRHFPDRKIVWAYSSRMVKERLKKKKNMNLKDPAQALNELKEKGHSWAVVQSLHLICGHEFYRLIDEAQNAAIRTSIGLPLLYSHDDYIKTAGAVTAGFDDNSKEAAVFVGHGTDHHSWSSYAALNRILNKRYSHKIYMGEVEHESIPMEEIVEDIKKSGCVKVRLIPFMLVAGVHFKEDLAGDEDSWKTAFEKEGIEVVLEPDGIGLNEKIVEIFCSHIREAIEVIPIKQETAK